MKNYSNELQLVCQNSVDRVISNALYDQLWTGEGPYKKFDTTLKLCRALMNNKRTPEDPEHHMDTFYEGQPGEQSRGAILRANVAMPCWEREPGSRVAMKTVRNTLQQKFGPFTRP